MSVLNISALLRNDSVSTITLGSLSINAGASVEIWDTVNFDAGVFANFAQVITATATFNQNIGNGNLVLVVNSVDQTLSQAFALFTEMVSLYSETSTAEGYLSLLRSVGSSVIGLTGNASNVRPGLFSPDGYAQLADLVENKAVESEPTGFYPPGFENPSTISKNDGTRTFTITPTGPELNFWVKGNKQTINSPQSIVWSDVEGQHIIYFDDTATLQVTMDHVLVEQIILGSGAIVAYVYWDAANNVGTMFEERHGLQMDGATHLYLHLTAGAKYVSGGALDTFNADGYGDVDADVQFAVEDCSIFDEDIPLNTANYSQQLTFPAQIPIFYQSGDDGYWRKKAANDYPLIYSDGVNFIGPNGRIPYNEFTGLTWQLTEVNDGYYTLCFYFMTGVYDEGIIGILGQSQYDNETSARIGAQIELANLKNIIRLLSKEFVPIGVVIYQSDSLYTNTVKARVVSDGFGNPYIDLRDVLIASNAERLNGQDASFYTNAESLVSGILPGARFDDTSHGNRSGGTLHATASNSSAGFVPSVGANGTFLRSDGYAPVWDSIVIGDVSGPASSTDNAIARYDLTTGKIIQNSGVIIDDSNNITGVANINGVSITTHATRHLPGGADALTTATPVSVNKSSNAEGTAISFSRSDHKHDIATAIASANPPGTTNAEGTSTSLARADHTHALAAFGNIAGTFCEGNDPRLSDNRKPITITRTLTVGGGAGVDFSSIKDAVTYAILNGAAPGNAWRILVYPGNYNEDPMNIIDGIVIHSTDFDTVEVFANNPNEDLFTCTGGVISNITASGVTDPLKCLWRCPTSVASTLLYGIKFYNCSSGVIVEGGASCIVQNSSVVIDSFSANIDTCFSVTGSGSTLFITGIYVIVPSVILPFYPGENPIQTGFSVTNSAKLFLYTGEISLPYNIADVDGLFVDDGSVAVVIGARFNNTNNAIHIGPSGSNTKVNIQSCVFENNVKNLFSESVSGAFYGAGSFDALNFDFVPGSTFSGIAQLGLLKLAALRGSFAYQYTSENSTDLGTLFNDQQSSGVTSGGIVTDGGGLTVDISNGYGWISRPAPHNDTFNVSWDATNIAISSSSTNFIIYNSSTEDIENSLSAPSASNILLATVITDGYGIRFLHSTRNTVRDTQRVLHDYLLDTVNIILSSGLSVSQGSSVTKFNVASGSYYRALELISFGGDSDATFSYFYGTNGANEIATQTDLNITQYDNAGTLTSLTSGYFRTDTVMLTSDGRVSVILGTVQSTTQGLAEKVAPASKPTFIGPTGIALAKIIVEEGVGIASIIDIRPVYGAGGAGAGGVSSHSALSDLDKPNDHLWAMLVDGTRAMTGDLDLGANDINNVGTVDGVDVSGHAGRHLPGGADALTTAAPAVILVGASQTEGSATSFARSDHQHGINSIPPVTVGTLNVEGTSSSVARADHVHAHGSQTDATLHAVATTIANGFMSSGDKSKLDGIATGATNTPLTATAPVNVTKSSAVVGVSTEAARADHKHDITTAAATANPPGTTNAEGTSTSLARADHTHALAAFGTSVGTFCQGNDSRLSDARTPLSHASTHNDGGADEISLTGLSGESADPQKITVRKNSGANVGSRSRINFIEGTNITITTTDDAGNSEVDVTIAAGGGGDVTGPGLSTDNAIARYDLTTGKIIQNSGVIIDDSNNITGAGTINAVSITAHAARHLPGGADALTTAAPVVGAVAVGNTAAVGTAASFARSDHVHTVTGGTPVNVTKAANAAGSARTFARSDHKHDITTATTAAGAVVAGGVAAEGSATSLSRSDHIHAVSVAAPVSIGNANAAGSATTFVRSNHVHALAGTVGGDLSGTLPNPSVTDLTITGEAQGDVLYFNGANWVRLAPGTSGQVLQTNGPAANPSWVTPSGGPGGTVTANLPFLMMEEVNNFQQWFYAYNVTSILVPLNQQIRSGNNAGIQNSDACSPIIVPFTGTITKAICILKGGGVQNGSVTYPVTLMTDLNLVGFAGETKLADVDFSISNAFAISTYSPGNTNYTGTVTTSIAVTEGQLLSLKFINGSGASQIGQMKNAIITFILEAS